MAVRKLVVDIMSYLKGDGFKKLNEEIDKSKKGFLGIESLSASTFAKLGAGIFSVSKAMEVYNKSIEAANFQRIQEIRFETAMRERGFREEQIEKIKRYASELQELGVIGDEVTLAGAQQMAAYNMSEQTMKKLLPIMQDIMVKNKGLEASGEDAVDAAKKLVKSLQGEAGELEEIGIFLTEHQKALLEVGTEEQRLGIIINAVNKNIGEQNKAFAATPEGKIVQVQNRIGDVYENIGFRLQKSRHEWFEFLGNNLDGAEKFIMAGLDTLELLKDGAISTAKGIYGAFSDMPSDVQNVIKLLSGFLAISTFPVTAGFLAITDIIGAFAGQKSVTEDVFNSLMNYLEYDYDFEGFKKDIKELWAAFDEGGWVSAFLHNLQASIGMLGDGLLIIAGVGKGLVTGDYDLAEAAFEKFKNRWDENQRKIAEDLKLGEYAPIPFEKIPIGEDGIDYNKPLLDAAPIVPLIPEEIINQKVIRTLENDLPEIEAQNQEINRIYAPTKENAEKYFQERGLQEFERKYLTIPKVETAIQDVNFKPVSFESNIKDLDSTAIRNENKTSVNINFNQKNETKIEGSNLSEAQLIKVVSEVNKKNNDSSLAALKNSIGGGLVNA